MMPLGYLFFSGSAANKGEVTFHQWKYEATCLAKDATWPEALILQAMRRSLRGMAGDLLLNLGMKVTALEVISELDSTFGSVSTSEQLLESFFAAKQQKGESVAVWGCRLSGLAREAREAGASSSVDIQGMLRSKLFTGLTSQHVKHCVRKKFEDGEPYETLLRAARCAEEELSQEENEAAATSTQCFKGKAVHASSQLHAAQGTDHANLEKKLDELVNRIRALEDNMTAASNAAAVASLSGAEYCYKCGDPGHKKPHCPLNRDNTKKGKQKQQKQSSQAQQQPGSFSQPHGSVLQHPVPFPQHSRPYYQQPPHLPS
jgi:hypothetical protein